MERDVKTYHGLDNRDLKLRNIEEWEFPSLFTNPKVKEIMSQIKDMEPGEMKKTPKMPPAEATLLRSAVWRMVRKHEMGVQVVMRDGVLYLKKEVPG